MSRQDPCRRASAVRAPALAGWVLLLVGALSPLAAQNLFENPEFDESLLASGWTVHFGGALDTTGDSDGCVHSLAGQLPSATTDTGTQWAQAAQCLPITPASWPDGAHLDFTYSHFGAQSIYAITIYYDGVECGQLGGSMVGIHTQLGSTAAGLQRVSFDDLSIPASAVSAWFGIGAEAGGLAPIELTFDRAYAGKRAVVFTDDFEPQSVCRWDSTQP